MWLDIPQNDDEWLDKRIGRVTGSAVGKVMANYGKAFGEPAKKLAVKLALEQITGKRSLNEGFTNEHTERGHEQEPIARMHYEEQTFQDVTNGGFYDCFPCGSSPDGRVGEDGLIEIKSVLAPVHYTNIQRGGIDPAYKWQIYFNLLISGCEWIDFVSFCVDFPEDKKLYIHRIKASEAEEYFEMIDIRVREFLSLVKSVKNNIIRS